MALSKRILCWYKRLNEVKTLTLHKDFLVVEELFFICEYGGCGRGVTVERLSETRVRILLEETSKS
jgi:hypothetical protein